MVRWSDVPMGHGMPCPIGIKLRAFVSANDGYEATVFIGQSPPYEGGDIGEVESAMQGPPCSPPFAKGDGAADPLSLMRKGHGMPCPDVRWTQSSW